MFKSIEHTEIVVCNMDKTLNFYTRILGFSIQSRRRVDRLPLEEVAFIELGDTLVEVFAVEDPAPVSEEQWQSGCRRIAIEVDDMDEVMAYLKENRVTISQEPVITETSAMAELKDPDGIPIQLVQRK
ncbi:VOC family protein [Chloroflexota bacterium]